MTALRIYLRHLAGRQYLPAGLSGLAVGAVLGLGMMIWGSRTSPVIINDVYELDGVAVRSGHLDIVVDADRVRMCPSETSRWLWTWTEIGGRRVKQIFPLVNTPSALTEIGHDQRLILSVPVPAGVWPGEWFYLSRTVEHCSMLPSFFSPFIYQTPDVPVRIEANAP